MPSMCACSSGTRQAYTFACEQVHNRQPMEKQDEAVKSFRHIHDMNFESVCIWRRVVAYVK